MHKQTTVNKIYDPAAGSGSLLLQAKKQFKDRIVEEGFFGQEINHTTYNLARMNMFLHNINYDKFNIALGNTLTEPQYGDEKPLMPSYQILHIQLIGLVRMTLLLSMTTVLLRQGCWLRNRRPIMLLCFIHCIIFQAEEEQPLYVSLEYFIEVVLNRKSGNI